MGRSMCFESGFVNGKIEIFLMNPFIETKNTFRIGFKAEVVLIALKT